MKKLVLGMATAFMLMLGSVSPVLAYEYDGVDTVFLTKLQRLTGITARPYTNYNLYDKNGDYLTDSSDLDLYDLLMQAGVGIRKE